MSSVLLSLNQATADALTSLAGNVSLLAAVVAGEYNIGRDLALWTAVIFLVLVGVLWLFAWGPISGALDRREKSIAEAIAASKRAQEEARVLLADYERRLAGTSEQVREMMAEAQRDAEHTKQQIQQEARASAAAERDRAVREIANATDASLRRLAEASADASVALAASIVRSGLSPDEHEALVEEALGRFPQMSPSTN